MDSPILRAVCKKIRRLSPEAYGCSIVATVWHHDSKTMATVLTDPTVESIYQLDKAIEALANARERLLAQRGTEQGNPEKSSTDTQAELPSGA